MVQGLIGLQGAQVLGVGTGDVDRHIVGMFIHTTQTNEVVVGGPLDGGDGILANVQAQQSTLTSELGFFHIGHERIEPLVVKTQSVDQSLGAWQSEHAGLVIARLRQRRDGAHFDKTKAHGTEAINAPCIFIKSCRHAYAVGKREACQLDGVGNPGLSVGPVQKCILRLGQLIQGEIVGSLRI